MFRENCTQARAGLIIAKARPKAGILNMVEECMFDGKKECANIAGL